MDTRTKEWIAWGAVSVVLTLVAIFLGVSYPAPPQPLGPVEALGTTHFTNISAEDIAVTDDLTVTDNAAITGLATVGETLGVTGDLTLAADVVVSPVTAISLTAGAIITPTGIYQPLTSAAAVTCSTTTCIAAGATGQLLILENQNASDAITIDGTGGTVECKADAVLAAGDTLTLIFDGTDWQCLSLYDNS